MTAERVVTFGPDERLVGVLTEPATRSERPCFVVLNAGFIHRAGPGRLGVRLARMAAEAGFPALRFDLSGIGDSALREPALDPIASGVADMRDAMDRLAADGISRFVLFGLCSGARHAHHMATADPRVVGAVMLDGYSFPTLRSNAMQLRERLEDPIALLASVRRRVARMFDAKPPAPAYEDDGEAFFPSDPTRPDMARDLEKLARRGVKLLYVYSGEWRKYAYEGQLRDAFPEIPLAPLLTERMMPTADHLYFTQPERDRLLTTVASWLRQQYG